MLAPTAGTTGLSSCSNSDKDDSIMSEEYESIQSSEGDFHPGKPQYAGDCFGFNVTQRTNANPLVTMFVEDDGLWHMKQSFDIHWIDDIIGQLMLVKKGLV